MTAVNSPLNIEQGTTYAKGWSVSYRASLDTDDPFVPIDATWTARGQVRTKVSSTTVLHDLEPTVNSDGSVVIGIAAATSSAWSWRSGVYDVEVVNADESVILRVAGGHVTVSPEVTR